MSFALCFWVLMLFALVFGFWNWGPAPRAIAGWLLPWFLFLLLGWKVFGPPLHG